MKKILLESSSLPAFEKLKNRPVIIAYSSSRMRDRLAQAAGGAGLKVCAIKESNFYFSPKKFNSYIAAARPKEETPILLKLALWGIETETGDREELTLEREEYGVWDEICDVEGSDEFYKKTYARARKSDVILIHHYGLARGLAAQYADREFIVMEAERLEDSFTYAFKKKFTESGLRPIYGGASIMLFGLIGIFYEHYVKKNTGGYLGSVILDDAMRRSPHFKRIREAAENLAESPKKREILAALEPQENHISWVINIMNEISLHSAPILLARAFHNAVKPFDQTILAGSALSADGSFNLIRELLELDSSWEAQKENAGADARAYKNLAISIPPNLPDPGSEGYFKVCLKLLAEIINEKCGKALFLMSSKKTIEAMYPALLACGREAGIKVLAVGPAGGIGKAVSLFLENPSGSVLMATNQMLAHLQEIENELETVIFQKIPFDPPNDPLLQARGAQFENSFKMYTLPRAIMRFREILAELDMNGKKKCYILDSRLLSREYGRMFI